MGMSKKRPRGAHTQRSRPLVLTPHQLPPSGSEGRGTVRTGREDRLVFGQFPCVHIHLIAHDLKSLSVFLRGFDSEFLRRRFQNTLDALLLSPRLRSCHPLRPCFLLRCTGVSLGFWLYPLFEVGNEVGNTKTISENVYDSLLERIVV